MNYDYLKPTSNQNIYYDEFSKVYYYKKNDNKFIPLVSPNSGGRLIMNEDGTYYSPHDKGTYILDERGVIPTSIPDDTQEPAHIEGDYLVGNNTNRKFRIDDTGRIIMPYDPIDVPENASNEEIKAYFEDRKERQLSESQEWIDKNIAKYEEEDRKAIEKVKQQREKEADEEIAQMHDYKNHPERKRLLELRKAVENGEAISEEDIKYLVSIMMTGNMENESTRKK